ncbi:MAG: tetratricopeptide repeat-containing protein, partial [Actinomycetia bacterium]|nr:tetratricopeptide repeat-containing protein [Actinomycetes bacterium]
TDPGLGARLTGDSWRAAAKLAGSDATGNTATTGRSRGVCQRILALVRGAIGRNPYHQRLLSAGSALARALGAGPESVDWAIRAERIAPSKYTAMALACSYAELGRNSEAEAAWLRAVAYDPSDVSLLHELADWVAEAGRIADGVHYAERALDADPENTGGLVVLHSLRYRRDGDARHLVALAGIVQAGSSAQAADRLAADCEGVPWLSRIPRPVNALSALVDRLLTAEGAPRSGDGTDPEPAGDAPSALLASGFTGRAAVPPSPPAPARSPDAPVSPASSPEAVISGDETPSVSGLGSLPGLGGLDAEAADLAGTPRPSHHHTAEHHESSGHAPLRPVRNAVWVYSGGEPVPVVGPPSAQAVARIRRMPVAWWPHPPAAYDQGIHLSGLSLDDLLGLLVHPPDPPPGELGSLLGRHDPGTWIRLVQAWSCLGIAHLHTAEPWSLSTRRVVLSDLAFGIEDWVTEAALFALVATAWVQPKVRSDVAAIVTDRLSAAAVDLRYREVPIAGSLAQLALVTPGLPESARRTAEWVESAASGQFGGGPLLWPAEPRWRRPFRR